MLEARELEDPLNAILPNQPLAVGPRQRLYLGYLSSYQAETFRKGRGKLAAGPAKSAVA